MSEPMWPSLHFLRSVECQMSQILRVCVFMIQHAFAQTAGQCLAILILKTKLTGLLVNIGLEIYILWEKIFRNQISWIKCVRKSVDDLMKNWMLFYLNEWKWHQCLRSWPVKTKNCAARRSKKCCFPVKKNPADAILWSASETYKFVILDLSF